MLPSCPCCHVLTVLSCLVSPFQGDRSGRLFKTARSRLSCPCGVPSRLPCHGCPATVVPSRLLCLSCHVLAVMFLPSCPLFPVLAVLSNCHLRLSLLAACPCCPVLSLLSPLFCPICPVPAVLLQQYFHQISCRRSPVFSVMSWLPCPQYPGHAY
jgi:hypothetical protein